jgi:glycosyltransferase involved in cell wall biosynthesis
MTHILINDGSRHIYSTGYGNLSRAIITSLDAHTSADLSLRYRKGDVPDEIREKAELDRIPVWEPGDDFDCILRVSHPPDTPIHGKKPLIFYTQNALGELIPEWLLGLKNARGIVVPSEFDADVFRRHFPNVYVCHQYVDEHLFKNRAHYRKDGPDEFSFLFVGSYGYRKGVDLLLEAFAKAFDNGQKVSLTLHCFTGLEQSAINDLVARARALPANVRLNVFSGTVAPAWMARLYNNHDCIVSFSRGEGWCMPLHEALLCEKPIIAPNSTAMGECLPDQGVIKVETEAKLISDITEPFGMSVKKRYGVPGNTVFEVDPDAAIAALREMYENHESYARDTKQGRAFITKTYSKPSMAKKIMAAVDDVMDKFASE